MDKENMNPNTNNTPSTEPNCNLRVAQRTQRLSNNGHQHPGRK